MSHNGEMTKEEFIANEKVAWVDVVKRLDFLTELVCAKTEKIIIRDAFAKLMSALKKHKPLFVQRMQIEFAVMEEK